MNQHDDHDPFDKPSIVSVPDPIDGGELWAVTLPKEQVEAIKQQAEYRGITPEQLLLEQIDAHFAELAAGLGDDGA
jgi:hypothetical protein